MLPFQTILAGLARMALSAFTMGAVGAAVTPAFAQILNGPAKSTVERHLGRDVVQTLLPSPVFYGDFDGDGRRDAVAFVYTDNAAGNGVRLDVLMFTGTERGFKFLRKAPNITGESPRNVRIQPGRISFVLAIPDQDDEAEPSKTKSHTIRVAKVRPTEVPADVAQTGSLARAATGETQSALPGTATGGLLGQRLCSATGKIQFDEGQLVIESREEPYILTEVVFSGCQGQTCTYRQPQHGRVWTATRQGSAIAVQGPVRVSSEAGTVRLVDDVGVFGPCQ